MISIYVSGLHIVGTFVSICEFARARVCATVFFVQITAAFEWQLIKGATSKLAIHRDVFISLVINYESRGLSSRNAFVV